VGHAALRGKAKLCLDPMHLYYCPPGPFSFVCVMCGCRIVAIDGKFIERASEITEDLGGANGYTSANIEMEIGNQRLVLLN
jgi:hypothetical protein